MISSCTHQHSTLYTSLCSTSTDFNQLNETIRKMNKKWSTSTNKYHVFVHILFPGHVKCGREWNRHAVVSISLLTLYIIYYTLYRLLLLLIIVEGTERMNTSWFIESFIQCTLHISIQSPNSFMTWIMILITIMMRNASVGCQPYISSSF